MPSIASGTVSAPVSRVRMQRIECSGRTQRRRAGAPAHRLRPGEVADHGLDGLGDDLGGGAAGLVGDGEEDARLLVGAALERVAGEAGRAQEALDRRLGGVGARALALLADRRARRSARPFDGERQAARRREGGGVGVGEAALDEAVGDEPAQVVGGLRLHPGGDFLGEELEQQVGHRVAPGFRAQLAHVRQLETAPALLRRRARRQRAGPGRRSTVAPGARPTRRRAGRRAARLTPGPAPARPAAAWPIGPQCGRAFAAGVNSRIALEEHGLNLH